MHVQSKNVTDLKFVQRGYAMRYEASHSFRAFITKENQPKSEVLYLVMDSTLKTPTSLSAKETLYCLKEEGKYTIEP